MKRTITIISLLALVASGTTHAKVLKDLPTPFASTLPIELRLTQQEIAVEVPNNGAVASLAVGGILGALVGAAINKASVANAEKRVSEIRNQMIDYDFSKQFETSFREKAAFQALAPQHDIKVSKTTVWADITDRTAAQGKDILVVQPSYSLTNKFDEVNVRMSVVLIDREAKSNGKIKVKYRHSRNYAYTVVLQPGVKQSANAGAEDVAQMGKDQLVAMINDGIDGVIEIFNISLSAEGKAKLAKGGKSGQYAIGDKKVRGMLFAKNADNRDVFFQKGFNNFFVIGKAEPFLSATEKSVEIPVGANVEASQMTTPDIPAQPVSEAGVETMKTSAVDAGTQAVTVEQPAPAAIVEIK